ncbi:hypothetical protein Tco_0543786 [Tanacetum coccineum]
MKDDKETDEHEEVEEDDEAEMKKHMEIVQDKEEITIDAIPLATKPLMIVEYKINIDREDLETIWKLVKTKHGNTRPEDNYERVLWGNLKVMFKPDIKSKVWRSLQGYKVTVWKLFDSCEVHFDEEAKVIDVHLYILMIESLMYLTTSRPDIMFTVCACARFQVTPKTSHIHDMKRIFRYLKGQPKLGLWYLRDSPFNLDAFSDSDYARASLDRKSTIEGCQFLGRRLISWQCKKQIIFANSTTEAEYVAASNCCGQVLWIQNQMLDYGFNFMNTKIYIDNESTICIVKNPVFHFKIKHIEIKHHFIRDSYEKKLIQVIKIYTDHNVADLPTKPFDVSKTHKPRKAKRNTKISLSSGPIHLVTDETIYKEKKWKTVREWAAYIASSLEAEQDSGNIDYDPQSIATT